MIYLLLSESSTIKAKEAGNFAFCITDVVIPEGMARVDAVACLADAGIYTTEDDLVHGKDGSDPRNERIIIKAAGHLGDSDHKHNLVPLSLSRLAEARPSSRTVSCELNEIGAYRPPCSRSERSEASVVARGGGYQVKTGTCIISGPIASKCFFSVSKSGAFMRGKRQILI